jgi:alkanesulfonate monooxygenase SsuD/methylene tetrahydromethanopterin reductase-like flavin-dependent oxidoreductase (luciferase family)
MKFGMLLLFANANSPLSDEELWKDEIELGVYAEELGLDSVWCPEHHFDKPYCISPDCLQMLTYLAARTNRISLGTAGIILPWHKEPLRLAERINMLDILSDGRMLLGFGRGLAKVEYDGFSIEMDDSRERFAEAAEMVLQGLETGVVEHKGKHFQQERAEVYPQSGRGWRDRLYSIAMSPPSTIAAAEFGGTLMCFDYQYEIEKQAEQFDLWRNRYKEVHGVDAPPPVLLDFAYCHEDAETADKTMRAYLGAFYNAMVDHYGFDGQHFGKTHGYESYQEGADMLREVGREAAFEFFYGLQWKGSPEQMIETMNRRRELIGEFQQMVLVSYGGMPYEMVRESLKLMSEKVFPEFRKAAPEHEPVLVTEAL